jgi:sec-independent protein translocase protein TatB
MFEFSFPELVVVCVIALLVLGPDKLPSALRTLGLWIGRLSRTFTTMKTEIEREIGMDEIRRQLHNEAVMDQIKRLERDVRGETGNGGKDHTDAGSTAMATAPDPTPATNSTSPATDARPSV